MAIVMVVCFLNWVRNLFGVFVVFFFSRGFIVGVIYIKVVFCNVVDVFLKVFVVIFDIVVLWVYYLYYVDDFFDVSLLFSFVF